MTSRQLKALQADLRSVEGDSFMQEMSAGKRKRPAGKKQKVDAAKKGEVQPKPQKKKKKKKKNSNHQPSNPQPESDLEPESDFEPHAGEAAEDSEEWITALPQHKRRRPGKPNRGNHQSPLPEDEPKSPPAMTMEPDEPGPSTSRQMEEPLDVQPKSKRKSGKTGKQGSKAILPKQKQKRYKASMEAEERTMLAAAITQSKLVAHHESYRSLVDSSDYEDGPRIPPSSTRRQRNQGIVIRPPSPDQVPVVDSQPDDDMQSEADRTDGSCSSDLDENYNSDETEDEESPAEEPTATATATAGTTKRRKKPKKFLEPNSDNDAGLPESDADDAEQPPDKHNWTRFFTNVKTHKFKGQTPGAKFDSNGFKEIDYFWQFFPLALFIQMTTWTNQMLQKAGKPLTSVDELRAWFGCVLVMAVCKIANYKDYWSTRAGYRNELISATMSRTRFEAISAHLACADPADNPDNWPKSTSDERKRIYLSKKKRPLYAVQPIWDAVLRACRTKYNPLQHLAIDEAMVAYKGLKAAVKRFFMPSKPIRTGFKMYALCESATGFMLNFDIHKISSTPIKMKKVAYDIARPFFHMFHHIFTDKLYSAIDLATWLLAKRTYFTGAIKMNSQKLPIDLSSNPVINKKKDRAKSIQDMKKTKRGTIYARQQGKHLTYVMWRDSAIMTVLSSAHNAFRNRVTDVLTRSFSIDGIQRNKDHSIPAPPQVISYTKHMGGVDRSDQLRSYFTSDRKTNTWWKHILYFLVDVARVNAWICYKQDCLAASGLPMHGDDSDITDRDSDDDETDLPKGPKRPNHGNFVMSIAEQLINGFRKGDIVLRKFHPEQITKAERVPGDNGPKHQMAKMKTPHGRQCGECKLAGRHRAGFTKQGTPRLITSRFGCTACGVFLCNNNKCFLR